MDRKMSLGLVDLDSRLDDIRDYQKDVVIPIPTPLGISSVSSIAPSSTVAPLSTSRNRMLDILRTQQKTEMLSEKEIEQIDHEIEANFASIERLSAEQEEALKKEAEEAASRDTWGVLATVAQYIVSGSSVILGIASISSGIGMAPGLLLVVSGGLGLTNRVMHDTQGWEAIAAWMTQSEELQYKIAQTMEMSLFVLSLGAGIAGGVWAYQTGAFASAVQADSQTVTAKIGQTLGLSGGALQVGSRVGETLAEKRISDLKARNRELSSQITIDRKST